MNRCTLFDSRGRVRETEDCRPRPRSETRRRSRGESCRSTRCGPRQVLLTVSCSVSVFPPVTWGAGVSRSLRSFAPLLPLCLSEGSRFARFSLFAGSVQYASAMAAGGAPPAPGDTPSLRLRSRRPASARSRCGKSQPPMFVVLWVVSVYSQLLALRFCSQSWTRRGAAFFRLRSASRSPSDSRTRPRLSIHTPHLKGANA